MDQAHKLRAAFESEKRTGRPVRATRKRAEKPPLVVAITSGKGGVGKTHISANLAWELTRRGHRVLVIDGDLGLANVNVLIGMQPEYDMRHFLSGEKSLREVLVRGPGGMMLLPASSGVSRLTHLSEEERAFILDELEELDQDFDVLLIDTAAGINTNVTYFAGAAQEVVVIVTPEPTSLADGYAIMKVLHNEHHVNDLALLVNQVESTQVARNVYRQLAEMCDAYLSLRIDYLGEVLFDQNVKKSVRDQHLFMEAYPTTKAAECLRHICDQLLAKREELWLNGKLQFFWKRMLSR